MTTLRMIVDQLAAEVPGGIGRYTRELTRELIRTAPAGCSVEGVVSAVAPEKRAEIGGMLPGLTGLHRAPLGRRELSLAWQYGLPPGLGGGMLHAPSLFAPLRRHDRLNDGDQVVVTIHDAVPWTHPETLTRHGAAWHTAMGRRAAKHADAIVVDTHAVAQQLSEFFDFGDRVRVIGAAVSEDFAVPADAEERADRLDLPRDYVLSVGTLEPRKGIGALVRAMRNVDPALSLLIVGPSGWGDVSIDAEVGAAGIAPDRVRALGFLSDEDLAVVIDRARVFVFPSLAEGFGLPVLEAFHLGTPVIHSDDPALVEVGGGAGVVVARDDPDGYPERIAAAIGQLVTDPARIADLVVRGHDRARAYSWRDSAERVWQLHADL